MSILYSILMIGHCYFAKKKNNPWTKWEKGYKCLVTGCQAISSLSIGDVVFEKALYGPDHRPWVNNLISSVANQHYGDSDFMYGLHRKHIVTDPSLDQSKFATRNSFGLYKINNEATIKHCTTKGVTTILADINNPTVGTSFQATSA